MSAPAATATDTAGVTPAASIDDVYAKLTIAAAVFFVSLEICYLAIAGVPPLGKPWVDATDYVLGRDFLNTWMGGRSMFGGGPAAWFDVHVYNQVLREMLGTTYPQHYWSYPPHIVLFTWPLGLMPYLLAYFAWCAVGTGLFLLASSGAVDRRQFAFLALSPAIAVCVFFGQNGFYTAALLVGGLLCLDRRPVLAGVLFGILTIKPQLGLLLPVLLLLERRWVTIAAAVITFAALVIATAMCFGWDVWVQFVHKTVPQQEYLTEHGGGLLYVVISSVFYGARLMHLPMAVCWVLQGIVSALALAATVWVFWKRRDRQLSLAFFITATFLFTPYALNYDMVMLAFVVAMLREHPDNTKADHRLLITVWSLPVTMMLVSLTLIPFAQIVLIAFACRLLWRLVQAERRESLPLSAPVPAACA